MGAADYREYDTELQSILVRSAEQRFWKAAEMRQTKLALCRWRLDYQAVYHEHYGVLLGEQSVKGVASTNMHGAGALVGPNRFKAVRALVRQLWERQKVPAAEIHGFLSRVSEAAAQRSDSAILLQAYH